jgi:putative nucleotidyltransferase with HDIG domain
MSEIRSQIIEALLTTERKGMEDLIFHLDEIGFFTQPASTGAGKHSTKEGGLAEHSMNVCNLAIDLNSLMGFHIDTKSIIIVALLHDVGKAGQFGKAGYVENILSSGKRSDKKPYEVNKELLPVEHEIRSVQIISKYIELTEEESFAILYHNGMYGALKYQLQGNETPLQMLIHFADMWSSRVIERGEE